MKKPRREVFQVAVHRVRPFPIGFDFVPGDDVPKEEMLEVKFCSTGYPVLPLSPSPGKEVKYESPKNVFVGG